ncbi:MAG TPA: succinylglutamate desuccinylase/aspartoacylase family protein [Woeseiaceae bacterium]
MNTTVAFLRRFYAAIAVLGLLLATTSHADELDTDPEPTADTLQAETTADESNSGPSDAESADAQEDSVASEPGIAVAEQATTEAEVVAALDILGTAVMPGTAVRLSWAATELFEGVPVTTPVLVIRGTTPGPVLCLTAAIHGDELNGIEIVRRVMHDLQPDRLSGTVIGVPIVNVQGFRRGSRYLPDRRDLNRYFPGNSVGSAASRIAHSFFNQVIRHCDALVDLHTGSFERANLPQLRADLRNPDVVSIAQGFGSTVVIHGAPSAGTLRYAATRAGVPTVTLEAGGPSQLEPDEVKHGVKGIETLLTTLGMIRKLRFWGDPEPVYYKSSWVRADKGGILISDVSLGTTVRKGDRLGTITDPMTNASSYVVSPYSGRIIGMARNQVVMPGFATFHIGIQTDEPPVPDEYESAEEIIAPGASDVDADIESDLGSEGSRDSVDEFIDSDSE